MAGYQPYPEYKDSGVEWLEEVPTHWSVKRIKNLATYNDESLDEKTDPDFEMEYVDISSVNLIDGITTTEVLSFEEAPSRARRKIKDGDTIISTVRTYLKAIAAIRKPPENMIVSTGFAVIRPKPDIDPGYLGYLLRSEGFIGDVVSNSVGVSYPAINASVLAALPAVQPGFEEQQTIARFLDHKTTQIDALIAKKEVLLEKLAEKRTALISHAVTKGLNPQAKMKDSGVQWLGDVPTHWEVLKLSQVSNSLQTGPFGSQLHAGDYIEGGIPLINPADIINGCLIANLKNTVSEDVIKRLSRHVLKLGDIVIARRGEMGRAGLVTEDNVGWMCGTGSLRARVDAGKIAPEYLLKQFSLYGVSEYLSLQSVGSTMDNLNTSILGRLPILLPPLEEQNMILSSLKGKEQDVVFQSGKVSAAIEKLKEYRSALITQAVTGKIDVRNIQILEEAAKGEAA